MKKIDWTQPIQHMYGKKVAYVSSKDSGKYRHLVICGVNQLASWVNDFGVSEGRGKAKKGVHLVRQAEPAKPVATPAVPSPQSPPPSSATSVGVEDLVDVIEALRQETACLKKQLFGFCENVAKLTEQMKATGAAQQSALLDTGMMLIQEMHRCLELSRQEPLAQRQHFPTSGTHSEKRA